ncbi:phage shock protein C (PspC) family protein [Halpernia humi]|uniref:Phage shock protein C (PspC) family protein n=1 Tax=Halpernia humi TaxID=493375 RepID=A0A1H5UF89_9FLAO|nr:PspC domain-containing protein [Halpernia humi]SEF72957.1 phage shock protein C (PspC) family protein [Halpernia humi]
MNKTLSIGLAGFSFTIEEHAYIKLSDYLAALRNTLDANEADEVMHDIEIRMVEIFKETLGKREVINDDDVEKVIAQIGAPEKIEEQEEAYYSEKTKAKKEEKTTAFSGKKQLFRDPAQQKIAGVCAGLAQYVGLDITAMRAIWLGLFIVGLFTAISSLLIGLVYIILWIVLPKAETAADYLKMKGKPLNFDNLKDESNKIVQFANESTQRVGEIYKENKPYINNAGNGIWNLIRYVLGSFFAFLAFSCIIGTFFIIGILGNHDFPGMSQFDFYINENGLDKVLIAMAVIGALIFGIIFSLFSIKLFSPKTKVRNVGYVIGALVISLIALSTYFGINMAKKDMMFKGENQDTQNISIPTISDTLYVDSRQVVIPQNFVGYDDNIYSDKNKVYKGDYPDIDITRKEEVKTPYLIIKKEGRGYNIPMNLSVPVEISGNKILFPNFMSYPYKDRFRSYHVEYELVVPKNTKVLELRENKVSVNDDENNSSDSSDSDSSDSVNININGKSIVVPSEDADSIIINGKKVGKEEAENLIKNLNVSPKDFKNIKIDVDKDGEKSKISIKTK